jgi:hypothetical protein
MQRKVDQFYIANTLYRLYTMDGYIRVGKSFKCIYDTQLKLNILKYATFIPNDEAPTPKCTHTAVSEVTGEWLNNNLSAKRVLRL